MSAVETATDGNKPAFLFDIDGTLLLWTLPPPKGYDYFPARPNMPASVEAYSPEHPEWFTKLINKEVEIAYASPWLGDAHTRYGEPLGLPEFDYIPFDDYGSFRLNDSKATAISKLYGTRPVALFDSNISKETIEWAKARSLQGIPTFLCKPNNVYGIQPENIEAANRWLGGLSIG
jgi:hypothetical protein